MLISRRNINNLRYIDDTTLLAESEEELNSLLMRVRKSEKPGLKLNIQKTKSVASSHHFMANRWRKSGNSNILFSWAAKLLQMVTAATKLKDT